MIRICKQCGKQFELTDSEIRFYEEKNLSLPKRCKECREANKQAAGGKMVLKPYEPPKKHVPKKYAYLAGLLAVLLLAGILSQSIGSDEGSQEAVYSAVEAGQAEKGSVQKEYVPETDKSAFGESSPDSGDEQLQAGKTDETQTRQESEAKTTSEQERAQETAQSSESTGEQTTEPAVAQEAVQKEPQYTYCFRDEEKLLEHFEKHGSEFGYASAEEYLAGANRVIADSNALHKLEAEDNDDVYYLEATNEFVIVSTDGYIRTYFKPDSGIDYYNKQ